MRNLGAGNRVNDLSSRTGSLYADPQRWFSLVIMERQESTYFE